MLKRILEEYLSIDGVRFAALVGRDGLVIEFAGRESVDFDALGAQSTDAMQFFEQYSRILNMGHVRQIGTEYSGGAFLITAITPEEFFVVVTDSQAAMGRASYVFSKTRQRVVAAM